MFNFIKWFLKKDIKAKSSQGPNTLSELLDQFLIPPKEKTPNEIKQDFLIKIAMFQYEFEFLKDQPPVAFLGTQTWYEKDKKCFDFVPCIVRPEVSYCSYGKN